MSLLKLIPHQLMSTQGNQLNKALGLAVAMHLLLALLLPGIPELVIPAIDRGKGIKVFLRRTEEPKVFEQSLNNPGELSDAIPQELQLPAGLPDNQTGADQALSDQAPQIETEQKDRIEANPSGQQATANLAPSIFITSSLVRLFAAQEARLQAERNPDALQRFRRTFSSSASQRRRPETDNYTSIFGDQYVRSNASDGDICFKQQREAQEDDFSKKTVFFFRCDREPLKLTLNPLNK